MINFDFSILTNLQRVSLNPNIESIPAKFLKGCKNIKSFEIGPKVKEIGSEAFAGSGLENIRIPSSVQYLDQYCFAGCESLSNLIIEGEEEQNCYTRFVLNRHQFQNCVSLKSVTIGGGVSRINPQEVFDGCDAVEELTISSSLDDIYFEGYYKGNRAVFESCPLKKITINRNYDSDIRENIVNDHYKPSPFSYHPTLEKVEIGGKATRLNMEAFKACSNLSNIEFNMPLEYIDNGAFSDLPSLITISLPSGIERLSDHIFENCVNLREVKLPYTVKEIAEAAFNNCKSLVNLPIHEGVESLNSLAFQGCISLTEIILPNSLKNPGSNTFKDCVNLCKVTIGSNVDHLDPSIFSGCPILYDFVFQDGDEYWDAWHRVENNGIFCAYPIKNLYLGRNHNYVTHYFSEQPFNGSQTLSKIVFGPLIKEIQPWAFGGCSNVVNIQWGENIERIGEGAFWGNKSIKKFLVDDKN